MNHGNFNLGDFQNNQDALQNQFEAIVQNDPGEQEMPNFSVEEILANGDDDQMKILCNFTCQEFLEIYEIVREPLEIRHKGGRPGYYSPATIFLITLAFLKSAMDFPSLQVQFGFTSTYLETLICNTVDLCSPILENWGIRWIPMIENIQKNKLFRFHPQCIAAVDGSVERIPRPSHEQRSYYSGKYGFHCLKMQVAVGPQGFSVDVKGPYKGSVHDFTIFQLTNTKDKILAERTRFVLTYP